MAVGQVCLVSHEGYIRKYFLRHTIFWAVHNGKDFCHAIFPKKCRQIRGIRGTIGERLDRR